MIENKGHLRLKQLGSALLRLEEAVALPDTTMGKIEMVIQRFEFTTELFWKVLKYALEQEKVEAPFPKIRLQKAYQAGWVQDEQTWVKILEDRNLTSHIYDESAAAKIAARVASYLPAMRALYKQLEKILKETTP